MGSSRRVRAATAVRASDVVSIVCVGASFEPETHHYASYVSVHSSHSIVSFNPVNHCGGSILGVGSVSLRPPELFTVTQAVLFGSALAFCSTAHTHIALNPQIIAIARIQCSQSYAFVFALCSLRALSFLYSILNRFQISLCISIPLSHFFYCL